MELSAVSTPVGGTQGHHAAGNGVLWRILAAGVLALSAGAENIAWSYLTVPGNPKNVGSCGVGGQMQGREDTMSILTSRPQHSKPFDAVADVQTQ